MRSAIANDGATISNSSVGVQLNVFMGAGNDTLTITGSGSSTPKAFLRGGAGTDTLNLGVDNTIGTLDQKEFETVNTIV
jgi:hypothetical protein